jgi:hypothetical protein
MKKYIIELSKKLWIAPWDGDPGRTVIKRNAKIFDCKTSAEKELDDIQKSYKGLNRFNDAKVIKIEYSGKQKIKDLTFWGDYCSNPKCSDDKCQHLKLPDLSEKPELAFSVECVIFNEELYYNFFKSNFPIMRSDECKKQYKYEEEKCQKQYKYNENDIRV